VGRGHVLPATSVTLVVDHVSVLVRVHKRVVVMFRQRSHLLGDWSLKVNWLVPPRRSLHRGPRLGQHFVETSGWGRTRLEVPAMDNEPPRTIDSLVYRLSSCTK
jgi:hypothetical protein